MIKSANEEQFLTSILPQKIEVDHLNVVKKELETESATMVENQDLKCKGTRKGEAEKSLEIPHSSIPIKSEIDGITEMKTEAFEEMDKDVINNNIQPISNGNKKLNTVPAPPLPAITIVLSHVFWSGFI